MSDATGSGYTAHAQIHVRLNKSGAHIAVVRFLNHVDNNYDVARLCSPRNGLARVSFRVTSVIFSITVLGSIIVIFFLYKNELTYIVKQ